jgi:RND superfamily putative drug exporter
VRRIATFVLAHRRFVLLVWLVVTIAGAAAVGPANNRLASSFALPGQPGQQTQDKLVKLFGNGGQAPTLVVITVPAGQRVTTNREALVSFQERLPAAIAAAAARGHVRNPNAPYRVTGYGDTGDVGFNTSDGRSTYLAVIGPVLPFNLTDGATIKAAAAEVGAVAVPGSRVLVTGLEPLAAANAKSSGGPGLLLETLVGVLGALLVLAFAFGSFLAIVPIIVAVVSILTTFLLVLGLTTFTDVSFVVQFLIALVGLGVAIDYSLLVVSRLKEEQAKGADMDEAIKLSMEFAGHAVVFSGVTVAVGLAALVALPVPFLRSVGYAGMLIPLISTLVSITFLPALLSSRIFGKHLADRLDWPRLRKQQNASTAWTGWARGVVKNRWLAAAFAIVVMGGLGASVFQLKVGVASSASLTKSGPEYDGLKMAPR